MWNNGGNSLIITRQILTKHIQYCILRDSKPEILVVILISKTASVLDKALRNLQNKLVHKSPS